MKTFYADFLVVGGGVAGVCCVEELIALLDDKPSLDHDDDDDDDFEDGIEPRAGVSAEIERSQVVLVSGHSGYVKVVTNTEKLGQITESFQVGERRADELASDRVRVLQDDVSDWDPTAKEVGLSDGRTRIRYGKLCIATGARPKHSFPAEYYTDAVLTLRDVDSVARLRAKISSGVRRVILVGNGGIATELGFELEGVEEVIWTIRHATISATYFDEAAAKFFEPKIASGRRGESAAKPEAKLARYTVFTRQQATTQQQCDTVRGTPTPRDGSDGVIAGEYDSAESGCALGPHWLAKLGGQHDDLPRTGERNVRVIRDAEVRRLFSANEFHKTPCQTGEDKPPRVVGDDLSEDEHWPVWVELSNGEVVGADFVIEATGVTPNSCLWAANSPQLKIATDGGILVDEMLRTTVPDVFAAGDVCTVDGDTEAAGNRPHWSQIRLWTQARQMGIFCARSMAVENVFPDICFDLFTHVTTFFGYKVVLLGDFSAAKLEKPYELHYRIRPVGSSSSKKGTTKTSIPPAVHVAGAAMDDGSGGEDDSGEYVKVIVRNSRVQGAVLIGATDLEETMENLILNQTDISAIESDLLNPDIDLEDYFD